MFHSGVGDTRTCMPTLVYRCTSILVQYLQSHASGCLPERELLLAQWGARDCLQRTRTRVWQRGMPEVAQNLDLKKNFLQLFTHPENAEILACLPIFSLWTLIIHQPHNLTLNSGVTNGGVRERAAPPGKLNVKTGPPLAEIFEFIIILIFSWLLLFLHFSGCLHFFNQFKHPRHLGSLSFLNFFSESWLVAPMRWSMGPLQLRFSPPGPNL